MDSYRREVNMSEAIKLKDTIDTDKKLLDKNPDSESEISYPGNTFKISTR